MLKKFEWDLSAKIFLKQKFLMGDRPDLYAENQEFGIEVTSAKNTFQKDDAYWFRHGTMRWKQLIISSRDFLGEFSICPVYTGMNPCQSERLWAFFSSAPYARGWTKLAMILEWRLCICPVYTGISSQPKDTPQYGAAQSNIHDTRHEKYGTRTSIFGAGWLHPRAQQRPFCVFYQKVLSAKIHSQPGPY